MGMSRFTVGINSLNQKKDQEIKTQDELLKVLLASMNG